MVMAVAAVATMTGVVTGQSEAPAPGAPVAFTGTLEYGDCFDASQEQTRPGVLSRRGGAYCVLGTPGFTDPRLDGDATIWWNDDEYEAGPRVEHGGFTIVNAEESWEQIPDINVVFPDGTATTRTSVLMGHGAYEGLTAIAEVSLADGVWSFDGLIFEGELPPAGAPVAPPE